MWIPPRFIMEAPVLMRLLPSIFRRYAKFFKHRYTVERRMGALFLLDQRNLVDRHLLIRGAWEARQMDRLFGLAETLFPAARGPRQFFDIGAHGALYAIRFALTGRPDDRVTAVECDPVNLSQLSANLLLNGLTQRVALWRYAASDTNEMLTLRIAPDTNRGGSRLNYHGEPGFENVCEVEARRLDGLWSGEKLPLVAKIDVEGHEIQVLNGMKTMLTTCPSLLQIEIFASTLEATTALLASWGYRVIGSIADDYYFTNQAQADGERQPS